MSARAAVGAWLAVPARNVWTVAALFMVGATLFALGSLPPYSGNVDPGVLGITFFVGSIFFTSAAFGQVLQVVNEDREATRFVSWEPRRLAWVAAAVQLVGTLAFNVSTFDAMLDGLSTAQEDVLVWVPDMFGSICFLVASSVAWRLVCARPVCVDAGNVSWWIAALNLVGSIAFGIAAITAFVVPTTGEVANIRAVNSMTFAGAICFFVGAALLVPEMRRRAVHVGED